MALGDLMGNFGRAGFSEDAEGSVHSSRDGPENTASSVVHFLVSSHLFQV